MARGRFKRGRGGWRPGARKGGRGRTRAKYTEALGRVFDSAGEAEYAVFLHTLQNAGIISGLDFQKRVKLGVCPKVDWDLDYFFLFNGEETYVDFKGDPVGLREARVKLSWARSNGMSVFFVVKDENGAYKELYGHPKKDKESRLRFADLRKVLFQASLG